MKLLHSFKVKSVLIMILFLTMISCEDEVNLPPEVPLNPESYRTTMTLPKKKSAGKTSYVSHTDDKADNKEEHKDAHVPKLDIVVPDEVQKTWKFATFLIVKQSSSKEQTLTIKIGEEASVSGSDLKLKVTYFLPNFKMDALTITSPSNDPANPAAYVIIYEKSKEIFKGWMYSKYPEIHPFEHKLYKITLKEGVRS